MNRKAFIEWLKSSSGFEQTSTNSDDDWRELISYSELTYDYLTIEKDKVIFTWEEKYWGGSNQIINEYSFKAFIEKYEADELKY